MCGLGLSGSSDCLSSDLPLAVLGETGMGWGPVRCELSAAQTSESRCSTRSPSQSATTPCSRLVHALSASPRGAVCRLWAVAELRLTSVRRVCTGGELPTPRGARARECRGREWCSPQAVRASKSSRVLGWESHALVAFVGKGLRCTACCSQTAARPSEDDNLVSCIGSCSLDLPLLCIATYCVLGSFCGSSLCKPHGASVPACLWSQCGALGRWLRWRVWRLGRG